MTRQTMIDSLFLVARDLKQHDPVGASIIRWAARRLAEANGQCPNCTQAYQSGYRRGYKRAVEEYGLDTPILKRQEVSNAL